MSLRKRDPDCLMKQQVSIPQKPRPPARFLFWLAVLGYLALHAMPTLADDLQTAYQQAAATSPVIAQARAQLDAELAGKPLAQSALLPHINAGASGGMNTAYVYRLWRSANLHRISFRCLQRQPDGIHLQRSGIHGDEAVGQPHSGQRSGSGVCAAGRRIGGHAGILWRFTGASQRARGAAADGTAAKHRRADKSKLASWNRRHYLGAGSASAVGRCEGRSDYARRMQWPWRRTSWSA